MTTRYGVLVVGAFVLIGCGRPAGQGLLDDDAAYKIPAIKKAVATKDTAAAASLIADLDSDDPAVRFYAIEGLRRLTGETFDYQYFADAATRRPAVDRWKAWLAENRP